MGPRLAGSNRLPPESLVRLDDYVSRRHYARAKFLGPTSPVVIQHARSSICLQAGLPPGHLALVYSTSTSQPHPSYHADPSYNGCPF